MDSTSSRQAADFAPTPVDSDPAAALASAVQEYRGTGDLGSLFDRIREIARRAAPELLPNAAAPYAEMPEVVIPVYERIVSAQPQNARALVVLANAYWLTGRGPELVGELATRALTADPGNRGAWHLWALSESNVRERVGRWQRVAARFPDDQLARAALADNAASLAGAEHDPAALQLAIDTYDDLLARATHPAQRSALESALTTLRGWTL